MGNTHTEIRAEKCAKFLEYGPANPRPQTNPIAQRLSLQSEL